MIFPNIPPQLRRKICLPSLHVPQDAQVWFHLHPQPSSQYPDHLCSKFSFLFCPGLGWKHCCNTKYSLGVLKPSFHTIFLPWLLTWISLHWQKSPKEMQCFLYLYEKIAAELLSLLFALANLPVSIDSCWSSCISRLRWWRRALPFPAVLWRAPRSLCSHCLWPRCVL